jgi:hypothetical protein
VSYEERPYALLAGATRAAFASPPPELGDPPSAEEVQRDLDRLAFVSAYLEGAAERAWLARAVRRGRSGAPLHASVVTRYDEHVASAVCRAITRYRSQVDDLFGGAEAVAPTLRAAARALGAADAPHAERTFVRRAASEGRRRATEGR